MTDEWTEKIGYVYAMEYGKNIHKNVIKCDLQPHAAYAALIIVNEVSQKEKDNSMTSITSGN